MRIQFAVSVEIDPHDAEMQARRASTERPITATDVVRDEILSNLHSVSYVRGCNVKPSSEPSQGRSR